MSTKVDQPKQYISLHARRLSRPSFVSLPPLVSEPLRDNYAGAWAKTHLTNRRGLFGEQSENQSELGGPSDLLALSQNFGLLFIGETFFCHINLHNDSQFECKKVILKAVVQSSREYTPLSIRSSSAGQLPSVVEGGGASGWTAAEGCHLRPQENFSAVIQHDLKEMGANTLICTVSYVARVPASLLQGTVIGVSGVQTQSLVTAVPLPNGESEQQVDVPMNFTKSFKFSVDKPFNFKQTQIPTSGSEIYVDAEIENLTPQALMLERIAFEPGPMLKVTDLNSIVDWTRSKQEGRPTSGFMAPHDVWRLLYCIQPLNTTKKSSIAPTEDGVLGHIDITWRSSMGETGRLLTQNCRVEPRHYTDVSMEFLELPTQVTVEDPFKVVCEITNRSTRVLDLLLTRPDSESSKPLSASESEAVAAAVFPAFIWTGMTNQRLENLAPGASLRVTLEFVPIMTGLQEMPPFLLREVSTENRFVFNKLGHVLVNSSSVPA
ncbi:hypothetical protein Aperf_G00000109658 [Anoplocephala perfoliata]